MIYEPETVKGFQDYLPPESLKRDKIKEVARKYFKLYGFLPVETPQIEFDELMRSDDLGEEDEAVRDRFRLKDRANRNLGLRYEFTFQLARIFKLNPNIKLPFKKYQIGTNFRDEPVRVGRTREFTQCDVDIIGDPSISADAECVAVMWNILAELGIKGIELQLNNRRLMDEIINSIKIEDKQSVMREIDKLEKIGEDQVKANLKKYADANQILSLFKLMEKDISFFKENAFEGAVQLEELIQKCREYKIEARFNPRMMRGFNYYTGNVFEIVIGKTALLGGGRYDKLVGKYLNKEIPAVGLSFSIEALMGLCEKEINTLETENTKVIIISISQDKETIKLAQKLRASNISCITSFDKIGKALEYADSYKIPYTIFIGKDEIKQKKLKMRDMKSGEETMLIEKSVISKLKKSNPL
ncbi:MAG: histidine--tRNA ligase [Nanoarchaeota archaeon]